MQAMGHEVLALPTILLGPLLGICVIWGQDRGDPLAVPKLLLPKLATAAMRALTGREAPPAAAADYSQVGGALLAAGWGGCGGWGMGGCGGGRCAATAGGGAGQVRG